MQFYYFGHVFDNCTNVKFVLKMFRNGKSSNSFPEKVLLRCFNLFWIRNIIYVDRRNYNIYYKDDPPRNANTRCNTEPPCTL